MSDKNQNVGPSSVTPEPPTQATSGGSGEKEGRLVAVEAEVAVLNARLDHLATKEEIQSVKVWILCGVLGGMSVAAALAIAILKLLS